MIRSYRFSYYLMWTAGVLDFDDFDYVQWLNDGTIRQNELYMKKVKQ